MEEKMDPTKRFSNRAKLYANYRPGYPKELISFLRDELNLRPLHIIADVGSGTGLLSKLFLDNGNVVYAVEPNREMRQAAESIFDKNPNFHSVDGTAEHTTLAEHRIDFVTVAQAFHWFDKELTHQEFKRMLKPNGNVILVYNDRKKTDGFMQEYERLLLKYAPNYKEQTHQDVSEKEINDFYGNEKLGKKYFDNYQSLDLEGFKGRLMSSSFVPLELNLQPSFSKELKEIFERCRVQGKVKFEYITRIWYGKITD